MPWSHLLSVSGKTGSKLKRNVSNISAWSCCSLAPILRYAPLWRPAMGGELVLTCLTFGRLEQHPAERQSALQMSDGASPELHLVSQGEGS